MTGNTRVATPGGRVHGAEVGAVVSESPVVIVVTVRRGVIRGPCENHGSLDDVAPAAPHNGPAQTQRQSYGTPQAGALQDDPPVASLAVDDFRTALDQYYRQVEAMVDLYNLLSPRAPMPSLRGWQASPDVIHTLVDIVWAHRPALIVECGSGASSVWLGYAVEQLDTGRVVALEHDVTYADRTRAMLRSHDLHRHVDVRLARLTRWSTGGGTWRWYARTAIRDLSRIGLVFVDGPPGSTGPLARYPALPVLLPRCTEDAVIVLDDAVREDERALSDRWLAEHLELQRTVYRHEKGTHVLSRRL